MHSEIAHDKLWSTHNRTFSADQVEIIRSTSLFRLFHDAFGECRFATGMPPYGDLGRERINWRLVRPGRDVDIGAIHADYWFDAVLPGWADGPSDWVRIKIWIPLYVEVGLTGFAALPQSQKMSLPFTSRMAPDGSTKPYIDPKILPAPLETLETPPGTPVIFSYRTVHRGANSGNARKTRVSMEATLEIPRVAIEEFLGGTVRFY